jgi:putative PEP-CTERM system histidine kinase
VVAETSGIDGVTVFTLLPFVAAGFSLILALASVLRKTRSLTAWCFAAGMVVLGLDSALTGFGLRALEPSDALAWYSRTFLAKSLVPLSWLCFSLTYSRGDARRFLTRWIPALIVAALLPALVLFTNQENFLNVLPLDIPGEPWILQFGSTAKVLIALLIIASVLILTNLEQTFRAAVGAMRWRIKFVIVAMAVIFGARIYVQGQAILFSGYDPGLAAVESGALLIGCAFLAWAYVRTGWAEIDVYPSLAVLRSSLTFIVVGSYLFLVGVAAQLVRRFGGAEIFQFQAFVVLLGLVGLAVLLLSDRFRQRVQSFAARHFRPSQHDSVRIWTLFSRGLANVRDQRELCAASVRLISETFDVLSATMWLLDEEGRLAEVASTAHRNTGDGASVASPTTMGELSTRLLPFDLENVSADWAEELRQCNPATFTHGGHRWCVPLGAGNRTLGVLVLADRVSGLGYTAEELELLKCIGDHITSVLLNLRLADEVARAKELEAFRTMSTFFVHDLKNAASSLNLMLKNLPVHFDDPAFRADALRGVGNVAKRIDDMVLRLTTLRKQPQFTPVETDLNQVVSDALGLIGEIPSVELTTALGSVPRVLADRDQIQSVVTNLVLNARDALGSKGCIQLRTAHQGGRVVLSVADNGCGMSPVFLKDSLFRPFQSTKSKGLGIGLFQARAIVQAHGGSVQVDSELGKGTTFHVSLPATDL